MSCYSKIRYKTILTACMGLAVVRQHMKNDNREDGPCKAYKCKSCGGWHLTSNMDWK